MENFRKINVLELINSVRFSAPVQIYSDQCRQFESNWF